jgi:hypothetical protein
VYEYAVEPAVLQNLPDNALLLTGRSPVSAALQPVECHPSIITMPHVSMTPLSDRAPRQAVPPQPAGYGQQARPQLAPREYQPRWPPASAQDGEPAWQPRQAPPLWPRDDPPDRRPRNS